MFIFHAAEIESKKDNRQNKADLIKYLLWVRVCSKGFIIIILFPYGGTLISSLQIENEGL